MPVTNLFCAKGEILLDFLLAVIFFLTGLAVSLLNDISIIAPMLFGLVCFAGCALYRRHPWREVARMIAEGAKKSIVVIRIFVLIGLLTAAWRASGTISFFVWYGIKFLHPRIFVLCAFVLSSVVSYALGSCVGTAGTIGVVLMVLARNGGADSVVTAGAVISGAFFGDRGAPVSSSANLVANLTETRLYDNVRAMFRTALIPTFLSMAIYLYLSLRRPMSGGDTSVVSEIADMFDLSSVTALPMALVLVLPLAGVGVKTAMGLSILSGAAISLWVQHMPFAVLARALLLGYQPEAPDHFVFARLIAGGGLISMARIAGIVLIASMYSGIFEGARLLDGAQRFLERVNQRISLYPITAAVSVATSLFACNQTLAVILTHQLMEKIYERRGVSSQRLALHLEDTAILIPGLIPWNIAVAVPLTMLSADSRCIPFAVFLWLVPVMNFFIRTEPLPKKS